MARMFGTQMPILKPTATPSYGLRALLELRHGSIGCSKANKLARKAVQLGGVGDAFTIAGTIERKCGDMNVSIENFKNALRTNNDNGYFIRRQLAGSYLLNANYRNSGDG